MSFSLFSLKLHPRWISCVGCLAVVCVTHAADPHGRSIQISEPRGRSINTNVNQLRMSGLKNLEADLSKPFQSLTPQNSLEGMMAPQMLPQPQATPVPTQREKERRDRKNNWVFMSPEEFGPNVTPEKIFGLKEYGADGVEKKKSTAIERFADRMNVSATNQLSLSESESTNLMWGESSAGDPTRSGGVFTAMDPSRTVFKPAAAPRTLSDAFSFNGNRNADDILREEKAQKAQMENFRQLWNFDQGSATAPAFQTPGFNPASVDKPAQIRPIQPVVGVITPTIAPAQSSLTPQPATPAPARTTTFQSDFNAPQRRF